MKVTRTRAFALLTIALLWAMTPAIACVLPGTTLSPAERECCHHMAEQCGSTMMPASHSCCQAPARSNSVLNHAQAVTPVRPVLVAVVTSPVAPVMPPMATMPSQFAFLHAPPEPSPGSNSVLRI
ncbi:MAG TPA: hypothetical protein VEV41_11620 [Terriglobales bacterium]|nr:hypothetical protein [Terriglobales bacterium]